MNAKCSDCSEKNNPLSVYCLTCKESRETKVNIGITVETVVKALLTQGYREKGGSDVFRILERNDGQNIKVYYNSYKNPTHIVVRESVEAQS